MQQLVRNYQLGQFHKLLFPENCVAHSLVKYLKLPPSNSKHFGTRIKFVTSWVSPIQKTTFCFFGKDLKEQYSSHETVISIAIYYFSFKQSKLTRKNNSFLYFGGLYANNIHHFFYIMVNSKQIVSEILVSQF